MPVLVTISWENGSFFGLRGQVRLCGALVPETTYGKTDVLGIQIVAHVVVVVVEVPTVREVAIFLCRTPEARVVALVEESAIVVAVARGQNSEAKGIVI